MYNRKFSGEHKRKISEAKKNYFKTHANPFKGKKHSLATRQILSNMKKKQWELAKNTERENGVE